MFKILGTDNREYGPVSPETIHQWITEHRINAETQVQLEGELEWRPLRNVPEFAASLVAPPPMPQSPASNSGINKVIPYRNVPALVGYYFAVFALIPFLGAVLGIIAFVLGIFGLRVARRNPAAGGKVHSWIGIILGGLCGFGYLALIILMFGAFTRVRF